MKILIIKTSSLGDVIHTLPAITDATKAIPNIEFHWVVEEGFAEIPSFHRAVTKVIPIALRRWRKKFYQYWRNGEIPRFIFALRQEKYDYIVDAQGLVLKSGILSLLTRGRRCGYSFSTAREPLASLCYQKTYNIAKNQHAITRIRQLFASVLNYKLSATPPNYGIELLRPVSRKHWQNYADRGALLQPATGRVRSNPVIIFIHGTSRENKCWPEKHWRELAVMTYKANYKVLLPWGNEREHQRALRIAHQLPNVTVLPKLDLKNLTKIMGLATAAIAVDTGLAHLAAALDLPTLTLYGHTNPQFIGTMGNNQIHLSAALNQMSDDFVNIPTEKIWNQLQTQLCTI